jgi:hypothetical protein
MPAAVNRDDVLEDTPLSDEELTALALSADPDAPVDPDAVPFGATDNGALLPDWYMPAAAGVGRTRSRAVVAAIVVGSLLLLNAGGLCVTYGYIELAL